MKNEKLLFRCLERIQESDFVTKRTKPPAGFAYTSVTVYILSCGTSFEWPDNGCETCRVFNPEGIEVGRTDRKKIMHACWDRKKEISAQALASF